MANFASVPNFLPSRCGFHFPNALSGNYPIITLPVVGTIASQNANKGLCGGFVFAALDCFMMNPRLPLPATTALPGGGSPLFNYISGRLVDSLNANGAKDVEWVCLQDHDTGLPPLITQRGVAWHMVTEEWPKIKSDIDGGLPSPLSLIAAPQCPATNIPCIIKALSSSHQVLAYAYLLDNQQNVTLWVYDCNDPDNDHSTMRFNIASPTHTTPITAPGVSAGLGGATIRALFRSTYSSKNPSAIAPTGVAWSAWAQLTGETIDGEIRAARNANGQLEVLAYDDRSSVFWHNGQTSRGSGDINWAGWSQLPATPANFGGWAQFCVATNADGRLELFALNRSGNSPGPLYSIAQTSPGGNWENNWSSLGGSFNFVTTTLDANGLVQVFCLGPGGQVLNAAQTAPGSDSLGAWSTLPGPISSLAPLTNADGRIEVFGVDSFFSLDHIWQTALNSPWPSLWSAMGAVAREGVTPAVMYNIDGRIELFAVNGNGELIHVFQTQVNNGWSSPTIISGVNVRDCRLGMNADGRLELFAVDQTGGLQHMWQNTAGSSTSWTTWNAMPAPPTGTLFGGICGVCTAGNGRLAVFASDAVSVVWVIAQS